MRVWPGRPFPLGATWDGAGVNFALFSEHATKVELCLFDSPEATAEAQRIHLPEHTDQVWHAYLPDVQPGQLYGYRVHGPYEPAEGAPLQSAQGRPRSLRQGHRPRPALGRLPVRLQDRRRRGRPVLRRARQRPVRPAGGGGRRRLHLGRRPAAAHTLAQDAHLRTARQGLHQAPSRRAREAARHLRGRGLGGGHPAPARPGRHGRRADAGAPFHVDDRHLVEKGLHNYWGYNTLAFFAPRPPLCLPRAPRRSRCKSSR